MTQKQDVCKKTRGSLQRVYKGSEHVTRQHAPSNLTACAGWADATNCNKNWTTQWATVSHCCARSLPRSLLKPCTINSNFFSQRFVASGSRATLSVGSRATLRLVPIVLTLQAPLARSSRHRHHSLSYPMLSRFRHSNAFVNPSAAFVCVGSLITVNFLSSCIACHKSLVSMCLRCPHTCRWMPQAVESILNRSLTGIPKNSRRWMCSASAAVTAAHRSLRTKK